MKVVQRMVEVSGLLRKALDQWRFYIGAMGG